MSVLFRSDGDSHIRNFAPFLTTTMDEIQSVGTVTSAMMPQFSISSSFALTSFFSATGIFPGVCCTGATSGIVCSCT